MKQLALSDDYLYFIVGYDFCKELENLNLPCDNFGKAKQVVGNFHGYCDFYKEMGKEECHNEFIKFCKEYFKLNPKIEKDYRVKITVQRVGEIVVKSTDEEHAKYDAENYYRYGIKPGTEDNCDIEWRKGTVIESETEIVKAY